MITPHKTDPSQSLQFQYCRHCTSTLQVYSVQYTVDSIRFSVQCTIYSTVYSVQCTVYRNSNTAENTPPHFTLPTSGVQCTQINLMHTSNFTVYYISAHCTFYSIYNRVYCLQYIFYSILFTIYSFNLKYGECSVLC